MKRVAVGGLVSGLKDLVWRHCTAVACAKIPNTTHVCDPFRRKGVLSRFVIIFEIFAQYASTQNAVYFDI